MSLNTPYLITKSLNPENQETPIHFLRKQIIPKEYFYRRNHFSYPPLTDDSFTLSITGDVQKAINIHYKDLIKMPSKHLILPLECSGNKRSYFKPSVYGEQWKDGAISQGEWTGVPLCYLLSIAGISPSAVEVLFEGHDYGKKAGYTEVVRFQRSLPLAKVLNSDTIVAYEYNRDPIPFAHGYPFRLIVPQWYAMASVKWLKSISVISYNFKGPFQTDDYVYYPYENKDDSAKPVTTINVNSLIQQPLDYQILDTGPHNIDGIAWTGKGNITKVEVSTDSGESWENAEFQPEVTSNYSWIFWTYKWDAKKSGNYTIMSRAYDSYGRIQPLKADWNRKGYGYNAVFTINIKIK